MNELDVLTNIQAIDTKLALNKHLADVISGNNKTTSILASVAGAYGLKYQSGFINYVSDFFANTYIYWELKYHDTKKLLIYCYLQKIKTLKEDYITTQANNNKKIHLQLISM